MAAHKDHSLGTSSGQFVFRTCSAKFPISISTIRDTVRHQRRLRRTDMSGTSSRMDAIRSYADFAMNLEDKLNRFRAISILRAKWISPTSTLNLIVKAAYDYRGQTGDYAGTSISSPWAAMAAYGAQSRTTLRQLVLAFMLSSFAGFSNSAYVTSKEDLPGGAFPALYYWQHNSSGGFGYYSTTYRYGAHPGHTCLVNCGRDLDGGNGYLVEHPSALLTIFAESEARAVATCCGYWQDIEAVYRTSPFNVSVSGGFSASWDASVWYRTDNTVRYVEDYAWWNFGLYSGRACPDDHAWWGLRPSASSAVEEFFCAPITGRHDPELNLGSTSCVVDNLTPAIGTGNPVHLATGNKFQRVRLVKPSGNSPLELELFYNSQAAQAVPRDKWSHTYQRSLNNILQVSLDNAADVSALVQSKYLSIRARRPDGKVLRFSNVMDWAARTTVNQEWSVLPGSAERLYSVNDPATGQITGVLLRTATGDEERYALNGQLSSIHTAAGRTLSLDHGAGGLLEQVTDDMGNSVVFGYAGTTLTSVTAPGGAVYRLGYDANGNMSDIGFPDLTPSDDTDNPRRIFHYENAGYPSHLTGVTDERGNRVATWTYDDQGRAISSAHADATDTYSITFNIGGTTTVTDPQGRVRTYGFVTQHGRIKLASIAGGDCGGCGQDAASYSYDANGFLASKTDHNGHVTTYMRDGLGRELSRTEAAGTPQARTVSTTWHPEFDRPVSIAEPGRLTLHTYDADGRLLSLNRQSQ